MTTNNDESRDDQSPDGVGREVIVGYSGWDRRHCRYGYGPEFVLPNRRSDGVAAPRSLPDWLR